MFHVKGAHLAVQRVGRRLLHRFGMTPARFDLMHALGRRGMRQCDLWRQLNVVRSVVCEMVRALRVMGWVKRVRAADGRTWLVQRTRRGADVFRRAYEACVERGDAAVWMDFALTGGHVESDAEDTRNTFVFHCDEIERTLETRPPRRATDLYVWRPEDYYARLVEPGEIAPYVPWVS